MKFNTSDAPSPFALSKHQSMQNSPRLPETSTVSHIQLDQNTSGSQVVGSRHQVAQTLLADFEEDWKINENLKKMRESFNKRLHLTD